MPFFISLIQMFAEGPRRFYREKDGLAKYLNQGVEKGRKARKRKFEEGKMAGCSALRLMSPAAPTALSLLHAAGYILTFCHSRQAPSSPQRAPKSNKQYANHLTVTRSGLAGSIEYGVAACACLRPTSSSISSSCCPIAQPPLPGLLHVPDHQRYCPHGARQTACSLCTTS
jgi:hypothetical protein